MSEGEIQNDVIQPQNRVIKFLNSPLRRYAVYVRCNGHFFVYHFRNGRAMDAISCVNQDIGRKLLPFAVGRVTIQMIANLASV